MCALLLLRVAGREFQHSRSCRLLPWCRPQSGPPVLPWPRSLHWRHFLPRPQHHEVTLMPLRFLTTRPVNQLLQQFPSRIARVELRLALARRGLPHCSAGRAEWSPSVGNWDRKKTLEALNCQISFTDGQLITQFSVWTCCVVVRVC